MIKVKNNRPFYSPVMGCYVIDYKTSEGAKGFRCFDLYADGVNWLRENHPDWYGKHFTIAKIAQ